MANASIARSYFLPLLSSCLEGCPACGYLGCRAPEDRDEASWNRAFARAQSGEYESIVFPAHLISHPEAEKILARVWELGFKAVLRIHVQALAPQDELRLERWIARGLEVDLLFTSEFAPPYFPVSKYTWVVLRERSDPKQLNALPSSVLEKLYFYFAPFDGEEGLTLSVREAYRFLEAVRREFPDLVIRAPEGLEIWDPKISAQLCLEGNLEPLLDYRIEGSTPEVSVIIPSYNSGPLLVNVIRHLLAQTISRTRFEIIIVDDGSTDGTADRVRNFIAPEAGSLGFRYLYFPRAEARTLGDGRFRAGISRNLGVKHARGRLLAFLDSDIIVPPNYLESLIEQHRTHDVVQCIRLHLKSADEWAGYREVDSVRDGYVLEKNYWGPFFATKNWEALPFFWKYTCTYSLSLKKADFKEVGWFRKTFVFYGFEDTDLGYRLWRAGKKFHLLPLVTYHLSSRAERTEYQSSSIDRHLLLCKTAKTFYLNTLDPAIYRHFQLFMGGERRALRVFSAAISEAWRGVAQSRMIRRRKTRMASEIESFIK